MRRVALQFGDTPKASLLSGHLKETSKGALKGSVDNLWVGGVENFLKAVFHLAGICCMGTGELNLFLCQKHH